MAYACWYEDWPLGRICLTSDGQALTGAWFGSGQRFWTPNENDEIAPDLPIFQQACAWLDTYFQGRNPGVIPAVNLSGVTPFRRLICEQMMDIPYGTTTTYGALAQEAAQRLGKTASSARAVGGAVGHNPIGIFIPCHRVIGANGSLVGYGGGLKRKIALLELEGIDTSRLIVPTKGTAL